MTVSITALRAEAEALRTRLAALDAALDQAFAAIPVVIIPTVTEAEYEAQVAEAAQPVRPIPLRKLVTEVLYRVDEGHGWLVVSRVLLASYGLSERDFSRYSYQDARHLYLEEDCDGAKFARAVEARDHILKTVLQDDGRRSRIRDLDRLNV